MSLDEAGNATDARTTLMIKNIPNKYSQKLLLDLIERRHRDSFDFFYLPIDFKNRCNVGYAFINMVSTEFIGPFIQEFHNKGWERFNSEKVCVVAYARIQGLQQLLDHFKNSSLLREGENVRPIVVVNQKQRFFPVGVKLRVEKRGDREYVVADELDSI